MSFHGRRWAALESWTEHIERLEQRIADKSADPAGMLGRVDALGGHMRDALAIAQNIAADGLPRPKSVVICGMGGSAIGADLVRGLVEEHLPVPIMVNRDYRLPGFVDEDTLVIASSYSGGTEETLSAYEHARQLGASVAVITTGGELGRRAEKAGLPVVTIPKGLQPRAALAYSLVPLLALLHRAGLVEDPTPDVEEAAAILDGRRDRLGPQTPLPDNEAKRLALTHYGGLPLIYGSPGWKAAVAYRWKCQVNENAKAAALWNVLPELNHNETEGWQYPELNRHVHVVMLTDDGDPEPIRRRMDATAAVMEGRVGSIERVPSEGKSPLARMMSLVQMADYVSVYLALLYGVDPTPVTAIEDLKRRLAAPGAGS